VIKEIEDNDVFEAIQLMKKYVNQNKSFYGFSYNEAVWIKFFLEIVQKQNESNPHFIAIGSYKDDKLNGFLTAASYVNYYDNKYVMDVKDCIVDLDNSNNAYVIYKLFDDMIGRVEEHGGKYWRADSIREFDDALSYGKLLNKRYKAKINISVRGEIGE